MSKPLTLAGDANVPAMPMTDAEANHLRRLLAWMRCEYMLDPDMQRGYALGTEEAVRLGYLTPEQAGTSLQQKAAEINKCPAYVRQAIRMLTKAVRDHDRASRIHDAADAERCEVVVRREGK